jgi:hypothetical protein
MRLWPDRFGRKKKSLIDLSSCKIYRLVLFLNPLRSGWTVLLKADAENRQLGRTRSGYNWFSCPTIPELAGELLETISLPTTIAW